MKGGFAFTGMVSESSVIATGRGVDNSSPRRGLRSFEWEKWAGVPTIELGPMDVIAHFDVKSLVALNPELTATDWSTVLARCSDAKFTLRELRIEYGYDGNISGTSTMHRNSMHDSPMDAETPSNSVPPNLLEIASQLPNTSSTFELRGALVDLSVWIRSVLENSNLSNLDLHRVKLCFVTYTDPPADLAPLVDSSKSAKIRQRRVYFQSQ
jgi:hypothetical protein